MAYRLLFEDPGPVLFILLKLDLNRNWFNCTSCQKDIQILLHIYIHPANSYGGAASVGRHCIPIHLFVRP